MATFNYVVLFVLVLFGSVGCGSGSAQDLQDYGVIIQAVVGGVSAALGVLFTLLTFWWKFDNKIEKHVSKIDAKIETTRTEIKEDSRIAHEHIGTNIRDVAADVRASEKRVKDNFNARFDDLRDYIKLALDKKDDG